MDTKNTQSTHINTSWKTVDKNADFEENKKREIVENLDIKSNPNYVKKIDIINNKDLKDMIKDKELIDFENDKKTEKENTKINLYIIHTIKKEIENDFKNKKIPEYMQNSINFIDGVMLWGGRIKNNVLRTIIQIYKGEIFPVKANNPEKETKENKYIRFQIDRNNWWIYLYKNKKNGTYKIFEKDEKWYMIGVDAITWTKTSMPTLYMDDMCILGKWDYFLRRHIDHGAYIGNMKEILMEAKKTLNKYEIFRNKNIKCMISSSRLFDPEFLEFYKNFRDNILEEERKKLQPSNIINTREETKIYWWYLPSTNLDNYDRFIKRVDKKWNIKETTLTKALDTYHKQWKEIKDWWSFIDLEKLEKWYNENKKSDQNQ